MAGIGFSLKRLFSKKGFFSLCRAYGYAGIICAGPMILGVIMLAGMSVVARIAGMSAHDRELMNCMLTYSLLVSLTVTSWFNMVTTRYVSDMLYEERLDRIMPSFYGSCSIMLVIGILFYGIFLLFSGVPFSYQLVCLLFSSVLIVVWMQMVYLTALKDYQGIVLAFLLSLMIGFLCALILVIIGKATILTMICCVIIAYGIMMVWYYKLLLDYFPKNDGSKYAFLRWFDKYKSLAFTGGFINLGLFAHLVIMYFGPLQVQVQGLFYGAPMHDVPALFAFFSILITTINFVTSVEVRFYPAYRNYYSLFNDNGSIRDIEQAETEMLTILKQELTFGGHKQLVTTILFVVLGSYILEWVNLGFTDTSIGIFRFLCAGYGVYAISNSIMLILLYFEDYTGAFIGTMMFAVVSIAATILQILFGSVRYYGMGFLLGGIVFYFIVWLRLEWYTRRLPYFLLCKKSIVPNAEKGVFAAFCNYLDKRDQKKAEKEKKKWKKKRLSSGILSVLLILCITGCGVEEETTAKENQETELQGTYVEKEELSEDTYSLREDKSIYAQDEETSVVTMYLTVQEGNAADNTNHTWTEINQYSTYYYEDNNLDRYNCEAILQIGDENGPVAGEFGYDDTVPNAAVQIRGQTSSRRVQKNYKIRIKDGMGEWRGQRTIALNKHIGDHSRIRNKLAYDLMKDVPEMIGARTQFVHLYVKDTTEGGSGEFEDYGLYTQVEQINKTFLKNHGLDNRGHLYKINFFEWYEYDEIMLKTDENYDQKAFEEYIEIKGNDDHTKLLETLDMINDYSVPIEEIVEKHFDMENMCYWMAFQILIGNYDVGSRNYYIYSPLNSEKWYFISWDNDAAFTRTAHRLEDNYSEGLSWEQGLTQFLHIELFNRIFKEKQYRDQLQAAIDDLRTNYLNYENVKAKVDSYAQVVEPYLYSAPDLENAPMDQNSFHQIINSMPGEIEENYQYYLTSLERPWPFFVSLPTKTSDGKLDVLWDVSYDMDGEDITYEFWLARDYNFTDVISHQTDLRIPEATFDPLEPGTYYIRVRATNESGYVQDCFDYCSVSGIGKVYGAKDFIINADGTVVENVDEE